VLLLSDSERLLRKKAKWIKSYASSGNPIAFRFHPLGFFYAEAVGAASIVPYRLHFWPDTGGEQKQSNKYFIHDHAYGFASYIISGKCEQKIYVEDASSESRPYSKYDVLYQEDKSILQKTPFRKSLKCSMDFLIDAGSSYTIEASTLHTFEVKTPNTLSLILKETPSQPTTARVFGPIEGEERLEFARIALDKEKAESLNMQVSSLICLD